MATFKQLFHIYLDSNGSTHYLLCWSFDEAASVPCPSDSIQMISAHF
jgi:hypothetical protein